ncbi:MAG TPA: DUF5666 domain-containing protein [bacterium]|jgi:hypothetical protein|nr:DUF5666 domain-containing protein [bacterium]
MRIERGFAIVLAILLMLAAAVPAVAQPDKVEVRGVIVAVDARSQSFLLREDRPRFDRMWVVVVHSETRFRGDKAHVNCEANDRTCRVGSPFVQRLLQVGMYVEVEGRLFADGRILAREIEVRNQVQVRATPPPIAVFPPTVLPPYQQYPQPPFFGFPQQTQILYPQNGAVITTPEFTVIGRSFPYAQVHVDVSTVFAFFTFGAGSADVTADGNGFFAATIRPAVRLPGATYRITASSQVSGYPMQPTTITVTQQ